MSTFLKPKLKVKTVCISNLISQEYVTILLFVNRSKMYDYYIKSKHEGPPLTSPINIPVTTHRGIKRLCENVRLRSYELATNLAKCKIVTNCHEIVYLCVLP